MDPTRCSLREMSIGARRLAGILRVPEAAGGLVVFAHGSGSSRLSPRNTWVAERLAEAGFASPLFDLLTETEVRHRANVFDIPLLGARMQEAVLSAAEDAEVADLPIGLFGASTGAAAALTAATALPETVRAVVSRGGRPDLAGGALGRVRAPTLLVIGGADREVLALNERAAAAMTCEVRLEVVPGATHLFEEPGALDAVVDLAAAWFARHLLRGRGA